MGDTAEPWRTDHGRHAWIRDADPIIGATPVEAM